MSSENKQVVVYPLDDLRYEIDKIINNNKFSSLLREITIEFEKKGLDTKSLQLLLDNYLKTASSLTDFELIAISKVAFKELKKKELDPERYFGEIILKEYENYKREEVIDNTVVLKDFKKINQFEFRGQISYKDSTEFLATNRIVYNPETQRSPKYRSLGSVNGKSKKLRIQNVDEKTIRSIADAILEKKFEDSEIVLNCEIIEGKNQQFKFIEKYKDKGIDFIGDIIINVDLDDNSPNKTRLSVIDGYHRLRGIELACIEYHQKTGLWLDGSIGVRLVRADSSRAKRIVYQTFLRSPDNIEWIETLKEDDYTNFVDSIVNNSKRLTIENTVEEAIQSDKLTSKSVLVDVTKKMELDVNNISTMTYWSLKIAKNFDIVYDAMKNTDIKINPYSVAVFVYISYLADTDVSKLFDFIDILSKSKDFWSACARNTKIEKLIDIANKELKEVIVDE